MKKERWHSSSGEDFKQSGWRLMKLVGRESGFGEIDFKSYN